MRWLDANFNLVYYNLKVVMPGSLMTASEFVPVVSRWHQSYQWVSTGDEKKVTYWSFRKSFLNTLAAFMHQLTCFGFCLGWLSLFPLICLFLSLGCVAFGFWARLGCPSDTRAAFCFWSRQAFCLLSNPRQTVLIQSSPFCLRSYT